MDKLLGFICSVLDCYFDELKSERRGEISKKRRIAILVLFCVGYKKSEISRILNKNLSSVCEALKNVSPEERIQAFTITKGYQEWKKCVENDFFN